MGYGKVTEVLDEGDESSALPNVLLAAQQHSQLVEKAGGKDRGRARQTGMFKTGSRKQAEGQRKRQQRKRKERQEQRQQPWGSWGDDKPKGTEAGSGMFWEVPATTFGAHYWKKLPCGVIRSFNLFFRSTITSSKQLLGVSSPAKNRLGLIF